ncbi:MAG: metal-dependent hydrolase [Pirellulales bacterium]|jgi:L-ascorbate metabolism protein UlaG (beta-lactamase superfamily)
MSTQLMWQGHGTWLIESGEHKIVLDPFFDENPSSTIKSDEVEADFILLSHGHFDHVGARSDGSCDLVEIAKRTGAQVVTIHEIAIWLSSSQAVKNVAGMNIGGKINLPFGQVKMVPAVHSSTLPDGTSGGVPAGFILTLPEGKIYFACDTGLFSDMKLIGEEEIELAVLPIGDLYTMGPADSITATKWIAPNQVAPAHYGTWPPIEQDAAAWAQDIRDLTNAVPHVIQPGDTITLG